MGTRTEPWPNGVPCWAELRVPDVTVAKAFYADVLGWEFAEPEADGYVVARVRGAATAGIGPGAGSTPAAWSLHLATDDVEATVAAVVRHGGTVLAPPADLGARGRLAIVEDPAGAAFGLWQAGTHIGIGVFGEPGAMTWADLRSTDPQTARTFYLEVFGFTTQPLPSAGPGYYLFASSTGEYSVGGVSGMADEKAATSHWAVYFLVPDADAALSAARSRGGSVPASAFDMPFGRLAKITDPAGAAFWVVHPLVEGV